MNREPAPPPSSEQAAMLGPEQPSGPSLADERLEMAIESTRLALLGAHTRSMKVELAEQMKRLISQRSPWKVAQMEKERGLSR